MRASYSGVNVSKPKGFFQDDEEEYVLGVSALFESILGDKDHDSELDVRIRSGDGQMFAERVGIMGHWVEGSKYLVALDIRGAPRKSSVAKSTFSLELRPKGSEAWRFNCRFILTFSDQSVIKADGKEIALNNSAPRFEGHLLD
ncbi:MAG: hypothetical protein NTY38_28325 [Acidobacteria bacterium]|nr:hypothetical protein [Acidobacteriota bacterium]